MSKEKICRTCAKSNVKYVPLSFKPNSLLVRGNGFWNSCIKNSNFIILDMNLVFKGHLAPVTETDSLPKWLCTKCVQQVLYLACFIRNSVVASIKLSSAVDADKEEDVEPGEITDRLTDPKIKPCGSNGIPQKITPSPTNKRPREKPISPEREKETTPKQKVQKVKSSPRMDIIQRIPAALGYKPPYIVKTHPPVTVAKPAPSTRLLKNPSLTLVRIRNCLICGLTLTEGKVYDYHMKKHAEEIMQCEFCDKSMQRGAYENHIVVSHTKNRPNKKSFVNYMAKAQQRIESKEKSAEAAEEAFWCIQCQKPFKLQVALDTHRRIFHPVDNIEEVDDEKSEEEETDPLQLDPEPVTPKVSFRVENESDSE